MKFSHIIEKLVEENITHTYLEQGRKFEKLTQKILQLAPQFQSQFQDVYLWSEFSDEFGIHQKDTGVDLMAQTHDGQWVAIQCKCFDADYKLRLADLKGFLGIKSIYDSEGKFVCEIVQSLLFHTCKEVSAEVLKALKQSQNSASLEGKVYGYYDLEDLGIDWRVFEYDNLQSLKIHTKKELRPHQKQAFEAIQKHFMQENNTRARITMACGTGKSLLAIHTIDKLVDSGEIALFLAPSLALTNQMIGEFFKESHSDHCKVFAVCSDTKVGQKNKGSEDMNEDELCIAPTTNPHTLAGAISHLLCPPPLHDLNFPLPKIIIFSTYQSIDVIIQTLEILKIPLKLIINDEAHRTAGVQKLDKEYRFKEISVWQKTHDNTLLPARHRLYLTATPRIYSNTAKENAQKTIKEKSGRDDAMMYSMDDEHIFGSEIYSLRFHQAITLGLLSDYRVIISFMRKETIARYLGKLTESKEAGNLDFYDAGQMIAFARAINKHEMYFVDNQEGENAQGKLEIKPIFPSGSEPMKRAVAFHSKIKTSKFITANFHKVDPDIKLDHIDGQDNASIKAKKLAWLSDIGEDSTHVLSNAKCLTEGIDVPNLDAVAFFDKRDSVVDIVQAVGRAIRKAEGKEYGYIILPLILDDEQILNIEGTLKDEQFKVIWDTLKALRSHDERLIDEARIKEVVLMGGDPGDPEEIPETTLFALSELFEEMKSAVPKNLGDLQYWAQYAGKVGEIIHTLRLRIDDLIAHDSAIKALFENFCKALQGNLNAGFKLSDAVMLIAQHIITKPIFDHIFPSLDFAKFDKVSAELTKLYEKLLELGLDSEIKELEKFYTSVRENAEFAQSDKSKQALIKNLYDKLFKEAFKKEQEKLGIVYTPIEGVDFIIHSVQYALKKHFNKSLSDDNVHIYDPFTGTGTFLTRLIQNGYLDSNLEGKYTKELWANEITLLGYYIAQINLTATYHERLSKLKDSQDLPFTLLDNLLFTDTFNTYMPESKGFIGSKSGTQVSFPGEYLKKNYEKIQELKNTEFKVIICNPPYSEGQKSANDDNTNDSYPFLDERIGQTYRAKSLATSTKIQILTPINELCAMRLIGLVRVE